MNRSRWIILAALFCARATVGVQYQAIASSTSILRSELGLGLDQIGLLIGIYFVMGLILAVPAGAIGARFGSRATVLLGLGLMTAGGLAAAFFPSWPLQLLARGVAGAGGVLVTVLMTKMVTDWFVGGDMATAMAVFVNSWPVGIAIALIAVPPLGAAYGLRGVFLVTAVLCAIGFALVALVYREPPGATASASSAPRAWPSHATIGLVLLAAMVWGWFNAGFALVFSFGPTMLIEGGHSAITAGSIVSLVLWMSIVSVPSGGYLADRFARPGLVIVAGATLAAFLILLGGVEAAPSYVFALLGLVVGLPAGPIMALPARVLKPHERAIGMGLFYAAYYAVMVTGPVLAGLIAKGSGSAALAFQAGAACLAIALAAFALFVALARRREQAA